MNLPIERRIFVTIRRVAYHTCSAGSPREIHRSTCLLLSTLHLRVPAGESLPQAQRNQIKH